MSIVEKLERFRSGEIEIKLLPTFDIAVVLGGGIQLFKGIYISSPYKEGSEKSFGGCGRVVTAAIFYHLGLAPHIIVSTGKTYPHPDAPTEASVMKNELMDYGVPDQCITVEEKSLNTLENAIEVARLLRTDTFKQDRAIALISNSFHLRRALAFFDAQGLTGEGRRITLISSDRIIYAILPEFRLLITNLYNTPSMEARIRREAQGVRDFYARRYVPRPPGSIHESSQILKKLG